MAMGYSIKHDFQDALLKIYNRDTYTTIQTWIILHKMVRTLQLWTLTMFIRQLQKWKITRINTWRT